MKTSKLVAYGLVILAVFLTALGGALDSFRGAEKGIVITKRHAWHDGMFLMLLALFLVIAV